jgi:hypothetical protein
MLRLLFRGQRSLNHEVIQGGFCQHHVMAVGTRDDHCQGHPPTVTQLATLGSPLAAIGGIGAGRGSTERGLGHHSVHALPLPGNAFQFVILLQACLPQAVKHTLPLPEPKAIIDRRGGC